MQEMEKQEKWKGNHTNVRKYNGLTFTREQKLVSTVWYHERLYTGISYDQLCQNFLTRFNMQYPSASTLKKWEKSLFKYGCISDNKKEKPFHASVTRWVYIPYIKDSLIRNPDMSLRARSQFLGISPATLHRILKTDLKEFHLAILKKFKTVDVAETTDVGVKDNEVKDEITRVKS